MERWEPRVHPEVPMVREAMLGASRCGTPSIGAGVARQCLAPAPHWEARTETMVGGIWQRTWGKIFPQQQWRGPLHCSCCDTLVVLGWEHGKTTHIKKTMAAKKKKQKPPAHIVHWHLCQTLRGGLKSLFGNTRAPHERWAGQGESETKQKRKTDSKHKWGLLVGSAGDEEENDAPSFNKPKLPVLTSCSCGVQIPQSNSHSTHEASRNDHQCPPPGHSHEEGRQMRTWGLHLLRLLSKKNYTCICRLEWKKITRQPHVYGIFWR